MQKSWRIWLDKQGEAMEPNTSNSARKTANRIVWESEERIAQLLQIRQKGIVSPKMINIRARRYLLQEGEQDLLPNKRWWGCLGHERFHPWWKHSSLIWCISSQWSKRMDRSQWNLLKSVCFPWSGQWFPSSPKTKWGCSFSIPPKSFPNMEYIYIDKAGINTQSRLPLRECHSKYWKGWEADVSAIHSIGFEHSWNSLGWRCQPTSALLRWRQFLFSGLWWCWVANSWQP